jgi:hypothetical protein
VLDDLLTPTLADQVREIARQVNQAPLQVVAKIVEKRVSELLAPEPATENQ